MIKTKEKQLKVKKSNNLSHYGEKLMNETLNRFNSIKGEQNYGFTIEMQ
jgi:hypothetical protein